MNITKPTFLIDKSKCIKNIEKIMTKVNENNLSFRPHFKTHQSAEIGKIFSDLGIDKITVSSIDMAKYFMRHGWNDITIAFPVNILEIDDINEIAVKINLNLLVLDFSSIEFLNHNLKSNINIFIKIDTGYHRTGINNDDPEIIDKMIKRMNDSDKLTFIGFLTHAGHTYNAKSKYEILEIHDSTVLKMQQLKKHFKQYHPIISIGNTPSCSLSNNFNDIDEIRPGNFVYYDITQSNLGSCNENEISVALAAPIVFKNADRNEIVIFGGSVHLSKEYLEIDGEKIYGKIVKLNDTGWSDSIPDCYVKKLSQEHGIVHLTDELIDQFTLGDLIGVLPVHSCMTANLMRDNTLII